MVSADALGAGLTVEPETGEKDTFMTNPLKQWLHSNGELRRGFKTAHYQNCYSAVFGEKTGHKALENKRFMKTGLTLLRFKLGFLLIFLKLVVCGKDISDTQHRW
jgi:hypothetical protein